MHAVYDMLLAEYCLFLHDLQGGTLFENKKAPPWLRG